MYCGHNLEPEDKLEGCCYNCEDKFEDDLSEVLK